MAASVLPFLLYFIIDIILLFVGTVVYFVLRNKKEDTLAIKFSLVWILASTAHYGTIVLSAGKDAVWQRDDVLWLIYLFTTIEALALASTLIPFGMRNINWGSKKPYASLEDK